VMIARHLETVKPMITLRRTFPQLMPQSAPRSLPGVQLAAPQAPTAPLAPPGGRGGGVTPPGTPGGGGKGAPGSLWKIAQWIDDHHVRVGNRVYDVPAICDYYKISPEHFCVSSLSIKPAGERLALCQHWGQKFHTSATSAAHVAPTDFNLSYIDKHFATAASAGGGAKGKGKGGGRGRGRGLKRAIDAADGA
jgi:hypothetical protein